MANPLGAAPSILTGAAIGGAAAVALTPLFEPARQQAWAKAPNRILDAATLARLVAQGGIDLSAARGEATLDGYAPDKVDALVFLEQVVPGFGEAVRILRRNPAFADLFAHSLVKQGIDPRYYAGLTDLQHERLDPAVIALAIVRGIMADPHTPAFPDGFLPVGPPTTQGKVPAFPVSALDTMTEAQASGLDDLRLFVQTAIAGRPMGPEAAAAGVFRGILELADYQRAIAEGDVRNEWAAAIFETARQIPSPSDYVRMTIKGWIQTPDMHAGAARHGMSADDVDLLYLAAGRPAAPGQMATAVARGVDGPLGRPMDKEQFDKGIQESDIRPEWASMLWGIRHQYPPLFQLTRLVQAGAVDAATAADWAVNDRYAPEVVAALRTYWESLGATTVKQTHANSALTSAITATKRQFLREKIDATAARQILEDLGVTASEAQAVVNYWGVELAVTEKLLTPAQIKKAYGEKVYTETEAIDLLVAQHYSPTDAQIFLRL